MSNEILERLKKMETGMLTDAMKVLGMDGWMLDMHPANPEHRICGRAFTLQYSVETNSSVKGYNNYDVVNEIKEGDVYVIAANNCPYSIIGENVQAAVKRMGGAGIVVDGKIRDAGIVKKNDLPVFNKGVEIRFIPGNFKIISYNVPVMCAGIAVRPGDYIVGDIDGVIVIPPDQVERVLYQAEMVADIEKKMEIAISEGRMKEVAELSKMKKCLRK